MTMIDDLERFLDEREDGNPAERFTCDDLGKATWAARKLARIRRQQAEVQRVAEERLQAIRDWMTAETEKLDRAAGFFEHALTEYHRLQLVENPKAKTIALPDGVKLACRKQQPEYVRDNDVLLAWAKANAVDCVKTIESVDWSTIKGRVAVSDGGTVIYVNTGEVVPGVTVEQRPDKFIVTLTE